MIGNNNRTLGLACAIGAQVCWGLFPLFIHLLTTVDSVDIVAHRIVWAFALLIVCLCVSRFRRNFLLPTTAELKECVRDRTTCVRIALAAIMIAINWLIFVWAVNHDHKVDASLGYFICPQMVVLLGVFLLRERLSMIQWAAVVLAAIGVVVMARSAESLPWVGLAIASSFATYALLKKQLVATALSGLLLETGFLLVPALIYLFLRWPDEGAILLTPWWLNVLLLASGLATIVPLALYATAIKHIRLSTMGLLQYIAPTMQFLIGVFVFNESFDRSRVIGFAFVWLGVIMFMIALFTSNSPVKKKTSIAG